MSVACSLVLQYVKTIKPSEIKLLINLNLMSICLVLPCMDGFFAIAIVDLLSHYIEVAPDCE